MITEVFTALAPAAWVLLFAWAGMVVWALSVNWH